MEIFFSVLPNQIGQNHRLRSNTKLSFWKPPSWHSMRWSIYFICNRCTRVRRKISWPRTASSCSSRKLLVFWISRSGSCLRSMCGNQRSYGILVPVKRKQALVPILIQIKKILTRHATSYIIIHLVFRIPRGKVSVLVVGGALEALEGHQNEIRLIINRRKGFIKLALRYGVDLVPTFSFGEQAIYTQAENEKGNM